MTELPKEFSVAGKFFDAVASCAPSQPDISFTIYEDRVLSAGTRLFNSLRRPAGRVTGASPAFNQVARSVELQNRRRGDATVRSRRLRGRTVLIGVDVPRTIEHPNVVVLIRDHHGNALHEPFIRQRLGPRRIDFINGRVLRTKRWSDHKNHGAGKTDRYGRRIIPYLSNLHKMFLPQVSTQDSAGNCAESS